MLERRFKKRKRRTVEEYRLEGIAVLALALDSKIDGGEKVGQED